MDLRQMVLANRSYRRFDAAHRIDMAVLEELVALARCTPSAGNCQPLKYVLCTSPECAARIFDTLAWAAYLADWPGPEPSERPTAYLVVLRDTTIVSRGPEVDLGIAAQTILLGAAERGLGGCMVMNVRKDDLSRTLALPEHLAIVLVIALGRPVETVVLEDCPPGGSIRYYRDAGRTHHVPKRTVAELIHARYG